MAKITIRESAGPILHPVVVDQKAAKAILDNEDDSRDPLLVLDTHTLRFEAGETYEVDSQTAEYFLGNKWAAKAAKDAEISEAFNTQDADDDEAERWEREVLAPARARQVVQTTRFVGTGTNEVVGNGEQDVNEGENVRVVNVGQDEFFDAEIDALDVHNSSSGSGSNV